MILDLTTLLSSNQAITASAASTNVLDTGANGTVYGASSALGRDQGKGNPVPLLIQVTETFATLTSLTITVESDDNAAFSSAKTVATTGAITLASGRLAAGQQFVIDTLPLGTDERYLRLYYTVGGSNATAGKVTAGITAGNQTAPL
jgi:hypothetical protein